MLVRIVRRFSASLNAVALVLIGAMVLLTTADVGMRYFFNHPIKGGLEVTELILAGLGSLTIAQTQAMKGHIRVEMLVSRFPRRAQLITDSLMYPPAILVLGLVAYYGGLDGLRALELGQATDLLKIPVSPFKLLVSLGLLALCLELVVDFAQTVGRLIGGKT